VLKINVAILVGILTDIMNNLNFKMASALSVVLLNLVYLTGAVTTATIAIDQEDYSVLDATLD
jgi:hypothetical protein